MTEGFFYKPLWINKVAMLWCVLLLCGLTLAQDDHTFLETPACLANMCDRLKKFDALGEKLQTLEARLQNSESRLQSSETRLQRSETRLQSCETRLQNGENQIQELKSKERPKVIFSAALGGTAVGPFNTDKTLLYKAITNIGNAYNAATGTFTAPVAGVYFFTFFHHAGGQHETILFLYKNNQRIVQTQDHRAVHETAHNGGNAVSLQLQAGDRVYVRMLKNSYVYCSGYHTTFSGFLVEK
ncbi:complement C1q subcomponent subunit C-like [Notolabrus celidotus]|uniref:complement C1q subcomponent subunit C-like n=1 Tax=Notolabrus celidotus TaxID=1203425 RepID=UPI0014902049|nr:complement C1q subcomponent subunit C-like [Notolabrus celidotus]